MITSNTKLQQTVFPDEDRSKYKEFDVIRFVKMNRKLPVQEYGPFLFHCVVAIAGVDKTIPILENWNETSNINEIVTASDEAFALTLLVNYWDQFLAKWDKRVPARFTDRKLEKGSPTGNRKMQGGWSAEGMALFNELYDLVKKKQNRGAYRAEWSNRNKRRRQFLQPGRITKEFQRPFRRDPVDNK
jgi:hypothetical protein